MPRNLVVAADRQGRQAWLSTVPDTVHDLGHLWSLRIGEPFQPGGQTAWVAPATNEAGVELVVKVAWRHSEALHEAEGLRVWDGDGAVRLHAVRDFDHTMALLIERCVPGASLSGQPEPDQDPVIARLLRRLWRQPMPGHPFRPIQTLCDRWADEFDVRNEVAPSMLDRGLVRAGIDLFRGLAATADQEVLLCTDLHAGNVLTAQREPWLIIDPKPYVGDPAYDLLQHLLNCDERLQADPRSLARDFAGLVDINPSRLLLWLFARCVIESSDRPDLADAARRLAPS
jgi:streptomycin 6-kinase